MGRLLNGAQGVVNALWRVGSRVGAGEASPASSGMLRRGRRSAIALAKQDVLTGDWHRSGAPLNAILRSDLDTMRRSARALARDSDYVKRFLTLVRNNVVGPNGIALAPRPRFPTGKIDPRDQERILTAWNEWTRRGICTADGQLSWCDAQRLWIRSIACDGEVFVRKLNNFPDNKFRFALQFIEPERIETTHNGRSRQGNMIEMGVERNAWRRPVAYHVLSQHPGDLSQFVPRTQTDRLLADRVMHSFLVENVNQGRGMPWVHTAGRKLHMLGGYEEAELVAAKTAAAKMGFLKEDVTATDRVDDVPDDGDENDDEGHYMDTAAGSIEVLPFGKEFQPWDPQHPTQAFGDFVKAMLRGVASGLSVSYNSLAQDLEGVNYSSLRHGSLEERDFYRALQVFMIEHFCTPIFLEWLETSIGAGALDLPLRQLDKFKEHKWRPRGWKWVDPDKEGKGDRHGVELHVNSPQRIAAERGVDHTEIVEEIADAKALAEQHGLSFLPSGSTADTPDSLPDPDDD